MKIDILTLFPEMFHGFLDTSIIKRSLAKNVVQVQLINIRDFTLDKYKRVDDYPVGGGAGLIMKCQPIVDSIRHVKTPDSKVILLTPRGRVFNQVIARELSREKHLVFVCGHYEGVDERVHEEVDEMISLGDYILTGGELGAMVVSDAIIRLLDGAITSTSLEHESFDSYLLEHPQYTLPRDFEGKIIPDVLFSGNHKAINKYNLKESLRLTKKHRPDLLDKVVLTKEEQQLMNELKSNENQPKWLVDAIKKGKKFIE